MTVNLRHAITLVLVLTRSVIIHVSVAHSGMEGTVIITLVPCAMCQSAKMVESVNTQKTKITTHVTVNEVGWGGIVKQKLFRVIAHLVLIMEHVHHLIQMTLHVHVLQVNFIKIILVFAEA